MIDCNNNSVDLKQQISVDGIKDEYLLIVSKNFEDDATVNTTNNRDTEDPARFQDMIVVMIRNDFFRVRRTSDTRQFLDYTSKVNYL